MKRATSSRAIIFFALFLQCFAGTQGYAHGAGFGSTPGYYEGGEMGTHDGWGVFSFLSNLFIPGKNMPTKVNGVSIKEPNAPDPFTCRGGYYFHKDPASGVVTKRSC